MIKSFWNFMLGNKLAMNQTTTFKRTLSILVFLCSLIACNKSAEDTAVILNTITLNNSSYALNTNSSSTDSLHYNYLSVTYEQIIADVDTDTVVKILPDYDTSSCVGTLSDPIPSHLFKTQGTVPDNYYECTYLDFNTIYTTDTIITYFNFYFWELKFANGSNFFLAANLALPDTGKTVLPIDEQQPITYNLGVTNFLYVDALNFGIKDTIRTGFVEINSYDQKTIDLDYFFTIGNNTYSGSYNNTLTHR